MKKGLFFLFISFLCILSMLFSGCSSTKQVEIKKYFSSNVYISTKDINIRGKLTHNKKGDITLIINSPKEITGYKYIVKDKNVKMSFMDIDAVYKITDFPKKAPIRVLYRTFSSLEEQESVVNRSIDKDNQYSIKAGDSKVYINSKGEITRMVNDSVEITFIH